MVESAQGQIWRYRQTPDIQSLFARLRPPAQRGILLPREFIDLLDEVYGGASGELVHQLLRLRPRGELNIDQYLSQITLRRFGDVACVLDGVFYLFLFACRGDGLEPALGNICRLPWRDIFSACSCFRRGCVAAPGLSRCARNSPKLHRLATGQVTADLTRAITQSGFTPQRITPAVVGTVPMMYVQLLQVIAASCLMTLAMMLVLRSFLQRFNRLLRASTCHRVI